MILAWLCRFSIISQYSFFVRININNWDNTDKYKALIIPPKYISAFKMQIAYFLLCLFECWK